MKKKIVTFGEIMLRLAPYNYERIVQANQFQAQYGGGEANVAVSLANFKNEVFFASALPQNPIGDAARNQLRNYGVNTEFVLRRGSRVGIYFLEHGASIRPSKVTYDRSNSSISEVKPGMFDWDNILKGKDWFHTTGITPALSDSAAETTIEAVKKAKEYGLTVSCDLNYRNKLWSKAKAKEVMSEVIKYVDVIISNEEDAADVFGIEAESTNVTSGKISVDHYKSVAKQLKELANAKYVAITLRESISASDNNWSAMLYTADEFYLSRKYPIHLVDRVGGGDSFGGGLIHSLVNNNEPQEALEFAVAASALKQTIPGDMNLVSESEVLTVVNGDISGRVQR
ncbi:MAG: sugar kinase [Calditrichaeota bacterium]|nr:MAG: sugar kinase [Calditrichota bacterium]MBL1208111.1 sugar kinase [Calditrichota bacterium]NOG47949.1 sugar kinase [Calditrichota bacterium]